MCPAWADVASATDLVRLTRSAAPRSNSRLPAKRGHAGNPPPGDGPYRWDIVAAPLAEIANREKLLPPDFITRDGFAITPAARRYLTPLIQGETCPPFKNGLPDYVKLRNAPALEKLAAEFAI